MDLNADSLRYILGLKLRQHRLANGWGLKDVSQKTGLSVSYLSEIEKGRKYPKPGKLVQLATGLGLAYDDLVSRRVADHLRPVRELFDSSFLQEFPFHLFGLEPEQVVGLITEAPSKAGAFLRTFVEMSRSYDVRVEHFLFAALRSYQQLRHNYFADIEEAAATFLEARGWSDSVPSEEDLRSILERDYGYRVDLTLLSHYPELADLRSVWVAGERPVLLINERLQPSQRAFALARELGYLVLGHEVRSTTSVYLRVESFDQVVNDFEAAYFSGAVLLPKGRLVADLEAFFSRPAWDEGAFLGFLERYRTTPETFFYRLSQLLPKVFGFKRSFFLRFAHSPGEQSYRLTKLLNMSRIPIPLNMEPDEHYCRRWPGISLLAIMADDSDRATTPLLASVGRYRFVGGLRSDGRPPTKRTFLVFTVTRALSIAEATNTSVSVGFELDAKAESTVAFASHNDLSPLDVGVMCERCRLENCAERAAPPVDLEERARHQGRQAALDTLVAQVRKGG